MPARRTNIYRAKEWFKVLQTTPRSQTAVMKLGPGQATGAQPEAHEASDQVLLLVEGELAAEIAGGRSRMKAGCRGHSAAHETQVHQSRRRNRHHLQRLFATGISAARKGLRTLPQ